MDGLDLRVGVQASFAKLATDTALLDTTERHAEVTVIAAVDPHHTGLDIGGNTVGALNVPSEDCGAKAVCSVVSTGDGLVLGSEAGDSNEGSEYLLAVDAHRVLNIGEDSGLDEEATAITNVLVRHAAGNERRALGLTGLNVFKHAFVLGLSDLRALEGVVGEGVTDLAGGKDDLLEELNELFIYRVVYKDSGCRSADLTLVVHDTNVCPLGSLLEVGIFEDNQWRLAASLEGDVLQGACGHLHDLASGRSGTSEGDLVNAGVADQRTTSNTAMAVHNVNNTRGEPSLLDKSGQVQNAKRGLLGGLEDDSVTARKRRAQLPCCHRQGEVPRNNLANDTNWLTEGVGEFGRGGANGLTVHLVGPASKVAESVGDLTDIIIQRDLIRLA